MSLTNSKAAQCRQTNQTHESRFQSEGLAEYGALAQRYVREFDQKWLRGGAPADEPLVGSGDIQSLADRWATALKS
jgi:hypothetical protein